MPHDPQRVPDLVLAVPMGTPVMGAEMVVTKPAGLADLGQRTCAPRAAGGGRGIAECTLPAGGRVAAVGRRS
jgi:hypothetical protein